MVMVKVEEEEEVMGEVMVKVEVVVKVEEEVMAIYVEEEVAE